MRWRWLALGAVVGAAVAAPAAADPVAERITAANAAARLFGGTDADGGIGDWYLSNGIVEAVIDDAGPQADLPPGVEPPPRQSEAGVTGGTLIDLARVGHHNDQLNHLFTVGGLSSDNFVAYERVRAESGPDFAAVVSEGTVRGFEPLGADELRVVTEYRLGAGEDFLTLRTTATNLGDAPAPQLGGFLDVMPWTTRAIVPFSPLPERGFRHAGLDVDNPFLGLEFPAYAIGPGNVGPADGVMDPETGRRAGEVAYGLLGVEARFDPDGPGPAPPETSPVDALFGVSSVQATALGNPPVVGALPPGASVTYERRLYVGTRNDVASVADRILPALGARLGFATGTLSGDVDARDGRRVAAAVTVTRTGGPPIDGLPDGSPVTWLRTDPRGRFAGVVVPEGRYDLEVRAVERDPVRVEGVEVRAGGDTRVGVPPLSGRGTLVFRLLAEDAGGRFRPVPGRVTLRGLDGTPDPQFGKRFEALGFAPDAPDEDLEPETFGSGLAQDRFAFLPHGVGVVRVRPGRYEAIASRGPEYGLDRRVVTVREGRFRRVRFRLPHLVDPRDALSADFHVHSARSLDSSAGPQGRVVSFAGEGVEVVVSSDHDFVLDYESVIRRAGLGPWLASFVGSEVTTVVPNPPAFPSAAGHLNAWPLRVRPHARKDGAIEDEFVAPNWLFSRLRRAGAEVIQYNHPRAGVRGLTTIGFFNNIGCGRCENDVDRTCRVDRDCPESPVPRECTCVGYQPDRPLSAPPNDVLLDDDVTGTSGVPNPDGLRNIDFDVLEVGNGLSIASYLEARRDWFSLLSQAWGETPLGPIPFLPGTGVSDSHRNTLEAPGYFRTYVLGVGDRPAALDRAAFGAAVRAGRMVATTGPWVELAVLGAGGEEAGPGGTVTAPDGEVVVEVRVRAAPWIPVEEVRVIANGRTLPALRFDAGSEPPVRPAPADPFARGPEGVVRFEGRLALSLEADTWLLVEAGARLDAEPLPDPFASGVVPGLIPLSFTNPVFVDRAGDGFDPPGVEGEPPAPGVRTLPWFAARAAAERADALRHHWPMHRIRVPRAATAR